MPPHTGTGRRATDNIDGAKSFMPFERQESWAVPPRPAHGPLGLLFKKFVAFLWQIARIVPVLPTAPIYKPFAVNKMLAKRYLDTVEV